MPTLTFSAKEDGLMVPVLVCLKGETVTDLHANGLPIPMPIRCMAVVDCGTTATAVAPWILRQLGLGPGIPATAQTASGVVNTEVHLVSLTILGPNFTGPGFTISTIVVQELKTVLPGADVLVGLNAMLECNFVLEGPARQFSFIF
jgi:hypothetical protein